MRAKLTLIVCSLVLTFTILICENVIENCKYIIPTEINVEDTNKALRFLEIYSSGSKNAVKYLSKIATDNVVNRFSSLSGNSEISLPYPYISSIDTDETGNIVIVFDPQLSDYKEFYQYTFVFERNTNKIGDIKILYLYRGK